MECALNKDTYNKILEYLIQNIEQNIKQNLNVDNNNIIQVYKIKK